MQRRTFLMLPGAMALRAHAQASQQPVYVYLFSRAVDHINLDFTEDRLRRIPAAVERSRTRYPEFGASLLMLFSGTVSQEFGDRNPGTKEVDALLRLVKQGVLEIGYDGADEPAPLTRPRPNFRTAKTPQERWLARSQALEWFLTEGKDFFYGEPLPERSGGLKKTQEVFGEAAFIGGVTTELGSDSEFVHLIRQRNAKAVLPGLPEATTWPARNLHGFGGATTAFGAVVSPTPEFAPELFWQDNLLRCSDTSGPAVHLFPAYLGPGALKEVLAKLDRARPHVIRVHLGHDGIYLATGFEKAPYANPLQYAYANPKRPGVPPTGLRPRDEVAAACKQEETLLQFLAEEFFPANPGSRFVSCGDLKRMALDVMGSEVVRDKLVAAATDLLKQWTEIGNHPPSFACADGDFYSLADMFQMLTTALAELDRSGSLPPSVRLLPVYGPLSLPDDQGPSLGSVTVAAIARACSGLAKSLNDQTWRPVPENVIPDRVTVEGIRLNAAQFLRLMAQAFTTPAPASKLTVSTCQMHSAAGLMFPTSRPMAETGATWTIRPARLRRI